MANITVCICTHNPRSRLFEKVIDAIANQSVQKNCFDVLIVDNASVPKISKDVLIRLGNVGVSSRIVVETRLGLSSARVRAIKETRSSWILFVDDDNVLKPEFIENGIFFIQENPEVGCFGGRLLLPTSVKHGSHVVPFLPYLGVKDEGDQVIIGSGDQWGPEEPAGAGAWVHRRVLDVYVRRSTRDERLFSLGRSGKRNLASCDDSIMMRGVSSLGLKTAYVPSLVLDHHIDEGRMSLGYLMKLMWAYGRSHVILDTILSEKSLVPAYYKSKRKFMKLILNVLFRDPNKSLPFSIGLISYHLGARAEHLSQDSACED